MNRNGQVSGIIGLMVVTLIIAGILLIFVLISGFVKVLGNGGNLDDVNLKGEVIGLENVLGVSSASGYELYSKEFFGPDNRYADLVNLKVAVLNEDSFWKGIDSALGTPWEQGESDSGGNN